jgi:DNA polymerase III alpha subunit (gram-positive type)
MKIKRRNEAPLPAPPTVTAKRSCRRRGCILIFAGLLMGSPLPVGAQCETVNTAFKTGEKVTYDLYFNWKFIWTKAGTAQFTIDATLHDSQLAYHLNLLVTGDKKTDHFFKMHDTLTSVVSERLQPIYFRKGAEEGRRYTVDEVSFFTKDGLHHVKQKRTYPTGEVIQTEQDDSRCIYDMLSIMAWTRSSNLKSYRKGQRINFPVATGRKIEEQTLIYRGKENFTSEDDVTYRCMVLSLVKKEGGKETDVITFYITDDSNHLPVRLDLFLNFGSAKAFLNNVKGNKHPLWSVVKK